MPFPPSFDHVWDLTQPPDTQLASLGAQDFRNLKDDVMQRLSLLSGTLANRPTPETVNATWGGTGFGLLYFATDNSKIYQWNGSAWVDVTSSIIPPGNPSVVATVNLTAQQANIPLTTLYAIPSSAVGMYRINAYAVVTQAASTSGALPVVLIEWTDADTDAVVQAINLTVSPSPSNYLGAFGVLNSVNNASGSPPGFAFYAKASTNIQYLTTAYASSGVTPLQYALHLKLEYMGA